jgi:hypothetical protein
MPNLGGQFGSQSPSSCRRRGALGLPAAYRAVIVAGYLVALGIQGKNADEYLKRIYVPPDKRRRLGRF